MPIQYTHVKQEALLLPEHERAELANDLLQSQDRPADSGVAEAWDVEIRRRLDAIESGEAELFDADEVFTRIKRQLNSDR